MTKRTLIALLLLFVFGLTSCRGPAAITTRPDTLPWEKVEKIVYRVLSLNAQMK